MSTAGQPHVGSLAVYFGIFLTLLVLTGVTIGIAYVDLGVFNTVVALAIAGFKGTLVTMFFMHLIDSSRRTWLAAFGGLMWVALLITFVICDISSRDWMINAVHG